MPNWLLKNPECVLIHIPKTGDSTIKRSIWNSRLDGPEYRALPAAWEPYFKFAFVRHPLDRLVSAWADFTQLRKFKGTVDDFVGIVVDQSIGFDERRKTAAESIRHHTIPQTHPFNCLDRAEYVGRYENYVEDLNYVLERVGMTVTTYSAVRKTEHNGWRPVLSGETLTKAIAYYEHDFETLGYSRP
ncbi:MAG: sulfotransferase family 2 domain-containing protein [Parvibaculum sp.]|nr:sulfotransferase family 2 domain-containing protein [Parvibaculum sp.]